MSRRILGLLVSGAALVVMLGVCGLLTLMLVGDQVSLPGSFDGLRSALGRISLVGREAELNTPAGIDPTPMRFDVVPGDTSTAVAARLREAGLILDAELFTQYARIEGLDRRLQVGTYFLNQTQTIPELALALTDSTMGHVPFRVLAGWRLEEVANAVENNSRLRFSGEEFLQVAGPGAAIPAAFAERVGLPDGASLEGFLHPGDYKLPLETTPQTLRDALTESFLATVDERLSNDAAAQGLTLYEVVTLASIVQREAVQVDEQPRIAGAYRNRLEIGMKLDADPTVQYALSNTRGGYWPGITRADYTGVVSPYNTYLNIGLPPGPIANPSLSAIEAVVYAEAHGYYFFRADCRDDGYHDFAVTYEEHVANGCE